jgi:hypothetical protein
MQHSVYKALVLWLETRQTQKVTQSLNVATKAYIPSSSNLYLLAFSIQIAV